MYRRDIPLSRGSGDESDCKLLYVVAQIPCPAVVELRSLYPPWLSAGAVVSF